MDVQQIVSEIGSGQELQDIAARIGVTPDQAQAVLHGVLDHANNGGTSEEAVGTVAQTSGVDPSIVAHFLPLVLPLLQNHAANAPASSQGELATLMGSVGGLLGGNAGSGAGGLLGAAEGLFGRP